jgi:hypothetical protein
VRAPVRWTSVRAAEYPASCVALLLLLAACSGHAARPATRDAGPPPTVATDAVADAVPLAATELLVPGGTTEAADLVADVSGAVLTRVDFPPPNALDDPSLVVPAPMECGGQPCCGDPPQPCGLWIERQKEKDGLVLIRQPAPEGCAVFLDGAAWLQGRQYGAFQFVPPGPHVVECRRPDGSVLRRPVEAVVGQETGVRWTPP